MFILLRTLTYSSLFIAFVLVFVPARILARAGIAAPSSIGAAQVLGAVLVVVGAGVAVSCVLAFARFGRGTPAPFDPPRQLVMRGPYRIVRNPMYIGAGTALLGAALFYGSLGILVYTGLLLAMTHTFIVLYEEPTLRRTFGAEYEAYARHIRRWLPRLPIRSAE
jgi:protein-S-isoprenylcysteine O-methyltransferase Ste14